MIYKLASYALGLITAVGFVLYFEELNLTQETEKFADSLQNRLPIFMQRLDALEGVDEIKRIHNQFSYYQEQGNWVELSTLFSEDARFEQAQDGVFIGRERIIQNLSFFNPPAQQGINSLIQVQPIVHLSSNGVEAELRAREIGLLGEFEVQGYWREGIFENRYIKENGVWKINELTFYLDLLSSYELGWEESAIPIDSWHGELTLQADQPPSIIYGSYPELFIPPFHYENPVTGRAGTGLGGL